MLGDLIISRFCLLTIFYSDSSEYYVSPAGLFLFLLFQFPLCLSLISHLRCSLSDPGTTPSLEVPDHMSFEEMRYCTPCNQYKPPRSHHCQLCQSCIHKMDHHCFWVNNCIGALNHKFFLLFIFYTALTCLVGSVIVGISCYYYFTESYHTLPFLHKLLVTLITLGLLGFFLYTLDFLNEQWELIKKNQTTVDSFQRKFGKREALAERLKRTMGDNSWAWLLPINPELQVDYHEHSYNYSDWVHMKTPQTTRCSQLLSPLIVVAALVSIVSLYPCLILA